MVIKTHISLWLIFSRSIVPTHILLYVSLNFEMVRWLSMLLLAGLHFPTIVLFCFLYFFCYFLFFFNNKFKNSRESPEHTWRN